MAKLIVFDLDGTLLNTLQDLTNSVNYAMDKLKLTSYDSKQVQSMIGNGVVVLMQRAVTEAHSDKAEQALVFQRKYYSEHTNDYTKPYDGVCEMLRKLKVDGFTVAVHTNKDANCAEILCNRYFPSLVDFVLGTTDSITKPNPKKVLELMDKLQIPASRTVYCGDSDVDIFTAKNAGIKCISVTWGFRNREFLSANNAEYLADNPDDVIAIAKRLTSLL